MLTPVIWQVPIRSGRHELLVLPSLMEGGCPLGAREGEMRRATKCECTPGAKRESAKAFHFRVQDGNGWGRNALTTRRNIFSCSRLRISFDPPLWKRPWEGYSCHDRKRMFAPNQPKHIAYGGSDYTRCSNKRHQTHADSKIRKVPGVIQSSAVLPEIHEWTYACDYYRRGPFQRL